MTTMRKSLKKLVEVAKPVPGDEQEFVAKHVVKTFDYQGKDALSSESPYELILKNVATVKKPGDRGVEDHGHDAPGESEAAYTIPESRDAKIAKLSEMMGMMGPSYKNGKDEDEDEDEDEDDEDEDDDEDDEDKKELKEAKKQPVGVEMHYKHATEKPFKVTHFSAQDAERGRKDYEKKGYKLVSKKLVMGEEVEQVDENLAKNPFELYSDHPDFKEAHAAISKAVSTGSIGNVMDATKKYRHVGARDTSSMEAIHAAMKKNKLGEAVEQVDENLPLLPKQKQIARDLLKKEMEDRKKQRNDNRQAGTPKLMEEDRRDANNEVRRHIMATPRLVHKADTLKKMKAMLQSVNRDDDGGS